MALKHDTCFFTHRRLHDNHSFKNRDMCLLVVSKVDRTLQEYTKFADVGSARSKRHANSRSQ